MVTDTAPAARENAFPLLRVGHAGTQAQANMPCVTAARVAWRVGPPSSSSWRARARRPMCAPQAAPRDRGSSVADRGSVWRPMCLLQAARRDRGGTSTRCAVPPVRGDRSLARPGLCMHPGLLSLDPGHQAGPPQPGYLLCALTHAPRAPRVFPHAISPARAPCHGQLEVYLV